MQQSIINKVFSDKRFPLFFNIGLGILGLYLLINSSQVLINEPLWGWNTMSFFMGCWLVITVLLKFLVTKSKHLKYFVLSFVSGFLLYLGFPDPSITPLLFVGFVPLLYIVEEVIAKKQSAWLVFRYGYSAFLVWNIMATFWVANTSFIPSIVAFTLNSLFMMIPFMSYYFFRKRFKLNISLVAFVAFWVSWEMIHLRWEISWPWLTLGNAFSSRSLWVQWYEYTGHMGGSVWVLAVNALLHKLIHSYRMGKKLSVTALVYPVFLIMVPMFISFFVFFGYEEKGEEVNICVVQPNYEPHYEKFKVPRSEQLKEFINLVQNTATDSTDYIVFPETSFGQINLDNIENNRTIRTLYNALDSFPQASLVTGISSYLRFAEKPEDVPNLHELSNNRGYMQFQNSAIEIVNRQVNEEIHVKGKLVPGAEITPYSKFLFFLEPIIKQAGGSLAGHARSKDPTVLSGGKANIAPAICYESIYGYWMRKFVQNGADMIFVVTNDGWWDDTPGHRQHLAYSILRAIELRRSIARSANTGVSCTIDQYGRVFNTLAYEKRGAFNATMRANTELTFYAKYGDILGRVSWLLSMIFFAFILGKSVSEKKASAAYAEEE